MALRTVPDVLAAARSLVDPALAAAVDRLCADSQLVCRYHFGWRDAQDGAVSTRGGKALRPALVLLSARAARARVERVLAGAVAVELVHNWSLLHDDVIDRDEQRRHQPAAWTVFGPGPALLAGDALLGLAWQVLLEHPSPWRTGALARLNQTVLALLRGQQADLSFEQRSDVSVAECLQMSAAKTAALLSCSAMIGALLAGAPDRLVAGLGSFGRHLGVAFQGADDLLGTWGQPAATGKPIGNDLRQHKKTLPVVFALNGDEPYRTRLRGILAQERIDDAGVAEATALLERSGARRWVTELVEREVGLAVDALDGLAIPDDVHAELAQVARFVALRDT